jgi:hypothetical protein
MSENVAANDFHTQAGIITDIGMSKSVRGKQKNLDSCEPLGQK